MLNSCSRDFHTCDERNWILPVQNLNVNLKYYSLFYPEQIYSNEILKVVVTDLKNLKIVVSAKIL